MGIKARIHLSSENISGRIIVFATLLESLSNYDGDGNENVTKQ